jgi:hypothetical protein
MHPILYYYALIRSLVKSPCLILVFTLLSTPVIGQVKVKYNVDLGEIIDSGYYSPDKDRIILRGTFNNWAGFDTELIADSHSPDLFFKDVHLEGSLGDTIEYKYVIVSSEGVEYWEKEPDPDNPINGNRILVVSDTAMVLPVVKFDYDDGIKTFKRSRIELLREDYKQMRKALEEYHPALYDYTPKQTLDSLFDHYYGIIDSSLKYNDFYKYLSAVLERIGCGHTKLWIPEAYWKASPDRFFPLQLTQVQGKLFVSGFYIENDSIPIGSEIMSINGKSTREIMEGLTSIESSDGFIPAFKTSSVILRFPKKYAIYYGFPEEFNIIFTLPGSSNPVYYTLLPASREQVESVPIRGKELSLKALKSGNAAILTINSFIYYDQVPMFQTFIDSSFQVLRDTGIDNLILDIRGNDGGDPFCASYLFSYLEKSPVPYFSDHYGKYDTLADPIPMAENNFNGNIYVMIDGNGFSTTGHLCGLLKYHDLVTFVGTELGSTYTCTGNVHYTTLDHTQLILGTAQERRYSAAVEGLDPKQGIPPDHFIETSQQDIVTGRDTQLEFVLKLISR